MDFTAMAADIAMFIKDEAIDDVTLIGHSLGGRASMMCALLYPELISRLMVVDITPTAVTSLSGAASVGDAMLEVPLDQLSTRAEVDTALTAAIPDTGIRQWALQNLIVKPGEAMRWRLNLPVLQKNMDKMAR